MKTRYDIRGLNLIIVLFCLLLGCKSYRDIEDIKPKSKRPNEGYFVKESGLDKINKGEKILVELVSGEKFYMNYLSFSNNVLYGTVWKYQNASVKVEPFDHGIPLAEIKLVKVWRNDFWLTLSIPLSAFVLFSIISLIVLANSEFMNF
jgi:hypothetical protein